MARPPDTTIFLDAVSGAGGRISNGQLSNLLKWTEERYWRIHQQLFEEGRIEKGRGYGGTVLLVAAGVKGVSAQDAASSAEAEKSVSGAAVNGPPSERVHTAELDLYEPIKMQLQKHWALRRQFDECHCEVVALQGKRDTGGSWSRPDLCVIGSRKFEFYPDRVFELHTFEVKASNDVTVKGVLEALSHREAATRSYVLYHTDGAEFLSYPESARITELAGRHGIGVIAARETSNIEAWEEVVPAQRAFSDPEAVNVFIGRSLSDDAKRKIRKWFSW